MTLPQLRELYRRASLYWHATGFGFDENLHPLKQEHFGMSIIEAMSAGVVPLAFNGGGPRETIAPSVNGFLWNNPEELQNYTRWLMHGDELHRRMGAGAVVASRRFTQGEFLSRMDALIERLTASQREPTLTCAS